MTTEKTTHTPGAIRAAWDIMDVRNKIRTRSGLLTQTELAVLIDRETGVAALLEALSGLVQWAEDNAPEPGDPLGEWCEPLIPARTAIAAATEGDQP